MAKQIKYTIDADARKAIDQLSKNNAKLQETVQKLRQVDRSGKQAGKGLGSITSKLGGFLSLTAAIGGVTRALSALNQERINAATGVLTEEDNLKKLLQISHSSKQYESFVATGKQLAKDRGIEYARALGLVFEGASLGMSNDQIIDAGKYKKFSKNVLPLFQASAGISAAFGADSAGGTHDARVNALLAGAESSKVDVATLSASILGPAQIVKQLGGNAEETIAAMSVAAKGLKSVEVAETMVRAFATAAKKEKAFKGLTLIEALDKANTLPQRAQEKIFGRNVRASTGMGVMLENIDEIKRVDAYVRESIAATGTPGSLINEKLRISGSNAAVSAIDTANRAAQDKRISVEGVEGSDELGKQAYIDTYSAYAKKNYSSIRRGAGLAAMYTTKFLGGDPRNANDFAGAGTVNGQPVGGFHGYAIERGVTHDPAAIAAEQVEEAKKTNELLDDLVSGLLDRAPAVAGRLMGGAATLSFQTAPPGSGDPG